MKIGFYTGSFDPFTNGHLHVVKKAADVFDKVIIGIGIHPTKRRRYDKEEIKTAIEKLLVSENLDNVCVIEYDNLSVDVARAYNATYLIRGIRNGTDYEYEEIMAGMNEELSGLDTIYFRAGKIGNISSSMVVELLRNGKDVTKYLPKEIVDVIKKKEKI